MDAGVKQAGPTLRSQSMVADERRFDAPRSLLPLGRLAEIDDRLLR
jgi:hypothetical protein